MKLKRPSNEFHKKYKRQDVRIKKAIDETIKVFVKNPHDSSLHNKPLKEPYKGYRGIKILHIRNDHRAIYEVVIEGDEKYAKFIIFGTHAELFKSKKSATMINE